MVLSKADVINSIECARLNSWRYTSPTWSRGSAGDDLKRGRRRTSDSQPMQAQQTSYVCTIYSVCIMCGILAVLRAVLSL